MKELFRKPIVRGVGLGLLACTLTAACGGSANHDNEQSKDKKSVSKPWTVEQANFKPDGSATLDIITNTVPIETGTPQVLTFDARCVINVAAMYELVVTSPDRGKDRYDEMGSDACDDNKLGKNDLNELVKLIQGSIEADDAKQFDSSTLN